ncbi:uncharacterized protein PRCAT00000486001 [Priceomyces carsonii]|uniref:uncharacterized protein n=1 Tax=Priceomyces carsonii TaxID=28549 RepID=UPI002ED87A17|nr:unnamed protein product [Priceomyces carsonii]
MLGFFRLFHLFLSLQFVFTAVSCSSYIRGTTLNRAVLTSWYNELSSAVDNIWSNVTVCLEDTELVVYFSEPKKTLNGSETRLAIRPVNTKYKFMVLYSEGDSPPEDCFNPFIGGATFAGSDVNTTNGGVNDNQLTYINSYIPNNITDTTFT